jgi:uncharacterized protein DUF6328
MTRQQYVREDEDAGERLDRHWNELLQELRLAQTGTQILFAFLLTIAYQSGFQAADQFTHHVYAVTLTASAIAVALFLAPVSFHRMVYRQGMRDKLVPISHRLVGAGLVFLLAAIAGGVLLALDAVLSRQTAMMILAAVLVSFILSWYVLPAYVRAKYSDED